MRFILVFFLLLCLHGLKAQEKPQGYYITINSDTVYTTFKLQARPVFSFRSYGFFEELHIINEAKETVIFKPADIKGFFIEWMGKGGYFISIPIRNGKQKFFHAISLSPQLNIYGYTITTNNSMFTHFAFQKADGVFLHVSPDDGNQKTKKTLKRVFCRSGQSFVRNKRLIYKTRVCSI